MLLVDHRLSHSATGVETVPAARTALGREVEAAIITGDTSPEALLGIQAQGLRLMHKPLDGGLLRQLVGIGLPAWPTTSNEVRPGSHFGNPGDDFVS